MTSKRLVLAPLALIAVWTIAVWLPSRSMMQSAGDRQDQARAEQLALVAELDRLNEAADSIPRLDADLARVAVAIPAEVDMPSLVRTLDAEADEAGLRIQVFSPTEVVSGTGLGGRRPIPTGMSAVSLTLTGQGTYASAMDFLGRLADLPRLIVFDRLGLQSVDGGNEDIALDLEFRVFNAKESR